MSKRKSPDETVWKAATLAAAAGQRKQMQIGRLARIGLNKDEKPDVGFMARMLVICTLPHTDRELGVNEIIERTNGDYTLYVQPGPKRGLPYGMFPRLIMAWMTQEVQRTRKRELVLGRSLSAFMHEIGSEASWGKKGTATTMRNQMERLFSSRVWLERHTDNSDTVSAISVADDWQLWWQPSKADQGDLFESTVVLGEKLFEDMLRHPVPFDRRVARAVGHSPLAFDLYIWLTWRISYLKEPVAISWRQLAGQLGADYANPDEFARKARQHLQTIALAWPELHFETPRGRLFLYPSSPHVPKLQAQSGNA